VKFNSNTKQHKGVYHGQVITKVASTELYLRLGMGDFQIVASGAVANGRKLSDCLHKWISVKGDITGDEISVLEWLD